MSLPAPYLVVVLSKKFSRKKINQHFSGRRRLLNFDLVEFFNSVNNAKQTSAELIHATQLKYCEHITPK